MFVPHYAMSGGTLIALAADEIIMDVNAVLGQVDPQIGEMPAASIVKIRNFKKPSQVSDATNMPPMVYQLMDLYPQSWHRPALCALCAATPPDQRSRRSDKNCAHGADILGEELYRLLTIFGWPSFHADLYVTFYLKD